MTRKKQVLAKHVLTCLFFLMARRFSDASHADWVMLHEKHRQKYRRLCLCNHS